MSASPGQSSPTAKELQYFANLRDRDLAREGILIAEGKLVTERLIEAASRRDSPDTRPSLLSLACTPAEAGYWEERSAGACPVLALEESAISQIAGYDFHRGVIAAARCPAIPELEHWWPRQEDRRASGIQSPSRLLLCPELNDAENLGVLFRTAAGLGWDAIGLGPSCISPWNRRVVRVSMGNCLSLPVFRIPDPCDYQGLQRRGFVVIGTSLNPASAELAALHQELIALSRINPSSSPLRLALVFGNEYRGLSPDQEAACDRLVTIPMHRGTDSLNVSVAAGICMYELGKKPS